MILYLHIFTSLIVHYIIVFVDDLCLRKLRSLHRSNHHSCLPVGRHEIQEHCFQLRGKIGKGHLSLSGSHGQSQPPWEYQRNHEGLIPTYQ